MADNNIGKDAATGASLGGLTGPQGALIGAGVGALAGGAEYLINRNKAKKDAANRPQYNIPQEVGQGLTLAQQQALQGLPEAQKQQYLSNLQRGQAYSLGQIQSRKGGLAGIAALNENQNQGYANLLSQDSAARMANQKNVYGQLQNVADYKGQSFQLNQLNPYYENIARDQANRGALYQNVSKGAQLGLYAGMQGGGNAQGQPKSMQPSATASAPQAYNSTPSYDTGLTTPNPYGGETLDLAPNKNIYGI